MSIVKIFTGILFIGIVFIGILVVILYIYKKDNFRMIIPPLKFQDASELLYILYSYNTSLSPLKAEIKEYKKTDVLPSIFIYNPLIITPVRDQKNCGACWAFVIASLLADYISVKIVRFKKNLSVQELLTCYPDTDGCVGAKVEDVLYWLEKSQFKISINDNYEAVDRNKCIKFSKIGVNVMKNSVISLCKFTDIESKITPENENIIKQNIHNMKSYILTKGPIYSTISVYSDFPTFNGLGVYKAKSEDFLGGHALEIIGWCDKGVDLREHYKEGYWVCKNSWGVKWSKMYDYPGYCAIRMGYNECGIESRAGAAEPDVEHVERNNDISDLLTITTFPQLLLNKQFKNMQ